MVWFYSLWLWVPLYGNQESFNLLCTLQFPLTFPPTAQRYRCEINPVKCQQPRGFTIDILHRLLSFLWRERSNRAQQGHMSLSSQLTYFNCTTEVKSGACSDDDGDPSEATKIPLLELTSSSLPSRWTRLGNNMESSMCRVCLSPPKPMASLTKASMKLGSWRSLKCHPA